MQNFIVDVKVIVHELEDELPKRLIDRLTVGKNGVPTTWGEAIRFRINKQNVTFRNEYPSGAPLTAVKINP